MQQPSFDFIAPYYDSLARLVYGKAIRQSQTCFLPVISPGSRVLLIGGGSGWIIQELLKTGCIKHIDYVEASARMLQLAQSRYEECSFSAPHTTLHFIHGTEKNLPAGSKYDAILTFYVLDMQPPSRLNSLMKILTERLQAKGVWLFADFEISRTKPERYWHRWLVGMMILFFRISSRIQIRRLPDYEKAFTGNGLAVEKQRYFFGRLIISRIYRKAAYFS